MINKLENVLHHIHCRIIQCSNPTFYVPPNPSSAHLLSNTHHNQFVTLSRPPPISQACKSEPITTLVHIIQNLSFLAISSELQLQIISISNSSTESNVTKSIYFSISYTYRIKHNKEHFLWVCDICTKDSWTTNQQYDNNSMTTTGDRSMKNKRIERHITVFHISTEG